MENQFSRCEMLLGNEALKKLSLSRVIVFGVGGVGGYCIEALVRSGISKIDIVDNDKVSLSNLNRQIIALNSTIGKYKVDIAKDRILDINSKAEINTFKTFYTDENSAEFDFSKYDYVIDAIDTVKSKIELIINAKKANTPVISAMGAGNKLSATEFEVSDIYKTSVCPLARVIRGELKKRNIKELKVVYSKEQPLKATINDNGRRAPGSIIYAPAIMGLIMASEVIKDLIKFSDN